MLFLFIVLGFLVFLCCELGIKILTLSLMFGLVCNPRALLVSSRRVLTHPVLQLRPRANMLAAMASPEQSQQQIEKVHPNTPTLVLDPSQADKKIIEAEEPNPYKSVTEHRVSLPKALYRRPLPENCSAFASEEGKKIFMEALLSGHMNCYFRLASQFRTQDDPAYCGLATLIMVLNALEIDPGRVWKGPWKWYHEDMLDCCVPTELVRKQGITFDEFICIADCNSMDTAAVRVDQNASLEDFRKLVISMTKREDRFLIVSYSRGMLGQTGDGHFAPISGYHPERDLVLILDTARFKYPPHWVSLSQIFEAMKGLDSTTGLPRGYVEMWPATDSKALLLFKIAQEFSVNANPKIVENFQQFLSAWTQLLSRPLLNFPPAERKMEDEAVLEEVLNVVVSGLIQAAETLDREMSVLHTQEHISCANVCNVQCALEELLSNLQSTNTFRIVSDLVVKLPLNKVGTLQNLFGAWPSVCAEAKKGDRDDSNRSCGPEKKLTMLLSTCCDMTQSLCLCHFITTFLLSWPYSMSPVPDPSPAAGSPQTLLSVLKHHTRKDLCKAKSQFLRDEMFTLQRQLRMLIGYHSPSSANKKAACCQKNFSCDSKNKPV